MAHHEMIAMILAGGRGTRLYDLTEKIAKPSTGSSISHYRIVQIQASMLLGCSLSMRVFS